MAAIMHAFAFDTSDRNNGRAFFYQSDIQHAHEE